MRRLLRTRKVGHAGTLDPMATGVLVLGVGRSTRLLTYVVGADKTYLGTIRLGQDTVTDDAEGDVTSAAGASGVTETAVREALLPLTGDILQVPSSVSAIKVDGQRSYARVRSGEDVALPARPVTVSELVVTDARPGRAEDDTPVLDVDVRVTCSSGTYIRAIARDLGAALGTGGHLTALRRTRVGGFDLDRAADLDTLAAASEAGTIALIGPADAAGAVMPVRRVDAAEAAALGYGQRIDASDDEGPVAAVDPEGVLVAVLGDERRDGVVRARPVIVLAPR